MIHQADTLIHLTEAINKDLRQLDTWLQGNRLSLNVTETIAMLVCTKKRHSIRKSRNENLSLNIRGYDQEVVPTTKYLGAQIDNNLNGKSKSKFISFSFHFKFFIHNNPSANKYEKRN